MGACICGRSCGENRTDPDCPECVPKIKEMKQKTMAKAPVVAERAPTHGDFAVQATLHDNLLGMVSQSPNWQLKLTAAQRQSLNAILMKVSRICVGNPNEVDHWRDIGGYSNLIETILEKK